jgi:hypothetical protein
MKIDVTKVRTVHTYSELWHASGSVLAAGEREMRGSSWQFLSSAVLTAFTFEAYLNHVGAIIISSWVEKERKPVMAKFNLLCKALKVAFPHTKDQRPIKTLAEFFEFRNTLAHGKSEVLGPEFTTLETNEKLDDFLGLRLLLKWESLIQTSEFARLAREDVSTILSVLHAARPLPKEGLFVFGLGTSSATARPNDA